MRIIGMILLVSCVLIAHAQQGGQSQEKVKESKSRKILGSQESPVYIQQGKSAEDRKSDDARDQRESINLEIQGKSLDVSKKALKANEDTVYETRRAATAAVVTAIIALVATLFSFAAAVISYFQMTMFRRQLQAMENSEKRVIDESIKRDAEAKENTRIANENALAAKMSAEVYQAMLSAQLARLVFSHISSEPDTLTNLSYALSKEIKVLLHLQNPGKSFAKIEGYRITHYVGPSPTNPPTFRGRYEKGFIVRDNETRAISTTFELTPAQVKAVIESAGTGDNLLWICAEVIYADATEISWRQGYCAILRFSPIPSGTYLSGEFKEQAFHEFTRRNKNG